jgi:hypothetical protein
MSEASVRILYPARARGAEGAHGQAFLTAGGAEAKRRIYSLRISSATLRPDWSAPSMYPKKGRHACSPAI